MALAGHGWAADGASAAAHGAAGGHGAAAGNGSTGSGKAEGLLVAEVILLLVVGRLLGEAMQRIGQPPLVGQLLAGIVLGPSIFGALLPDWQKFVFPSDPAQRGMLDGLSQIGILMLLLLTGMETDLKLVRRVRLAAATISLAGIAVPFACGFVLGQFLPSSILPGDGGRLVPSLFLGTALSISSVKIVAMVVREMNFTRRDLGQVIVASAIIEDTVGWVIIAATFGIAGHGRIDALDLARTIGGIALFLVFSFTLGRPLVFWLIRWANDSFRSEFPVITAILAIMGVMAVATQLLGVHTVLGAFVAGVLIGESPILTDHIQQQLRGLISAFFMPIFFGLSGLSADLTILGDPHLLILTIGLVLIASVGKFTGAFVGASVGRMRPREAIALGCAMNARGSTEVVVASIGLSMGALTQNLYTMIVTMAVVTTLAMPPMLRSALARIPLRPGEKERLEREAIDERGFVPNLERLLLAVDNSAIGRFAARIAGLIAGAHGMPVTILKLDAAPSRTNEPMLEPDPLATAVKSGAAAAAAAKATTEEAEKPEKVHLTTRAQTASIAEEARKGYDLLLVGTEQSHDENGVFLPTITQLTAGFQGPLALLVQRAHELVPPLDPSARILVPVNGSPSSRHAAEVAFVLARASGARVLVLFVSLGSQEKDATLRQEENVLKDMIELAERHSAAAATRIARRGAAAAAILEEARRRSMIVMGVSVRPGERLFFGNTAAAVLAGTKKPVLFVAS
jgi:Kef-type K+ transport system membrane component KefB/nucleotide-binding universal stress UspA family protein